MVRAYSFVHQRQGSPTIFISDDGSRKRFDDLRYNWIKARWANWHFHTAARRRRALVPSALPQR